MIWSLAGSLLSIDNNFLSIIIRVFVIALPVLFFYSLIRSFLVQDIINKKLLRKSAVWLFVDLFVFTLSLFLAVTSL